MVSRIQLLVNITAALTGSYFLQSCKSNKSTQPSSETVSEHEKLEQEIAEHALGPLNDSQKKKLRSAVKKYLDEQRAGATPSNEPSLDKHCLANVKQLTDKDYTTAIDDVTKYIQKGGSERNNSEDDEDMVQAVKQFLNNKGSNTDMRKAVFHAYYQVWFGEPLWSM